MLIMQSSNKIEEFVEIEVHQFDFRQACIAVMLETRLDDCSRSRIPLLLLSLYFSPLPPPNHYDTWGNYCNWNFVFPLTISNKI